MPSYIVKAGDVVEVRQRSRDLTSIQLALEASDGRGVPGWLEQDRAAFKGMVRAVPTKEEIAIPVNEQLVVELYSR